MSIELLARLVVRSGLHGTFSFLSEVDAELYCTLRLLNVSRLLEPLRVVITLFGIHHLVLNGLLLRVLNQVLSAGHPHERLLLLLTVSTL